MTDALEANIRIEGLDKLLRKLGKLGPAVYGPAVTEAATHIKSVIASYPPRILGRKQPPKTMRQRIFLIHAIEEGLIEFPYRRTGGLGRKWTIVFRDDGKTAVVGNNTPGAPFVHDPNLQSAFHEGGGWKTTRQVAEQESSAVQAILARHIAQWSNSKA